MFLKESSASLADNILRFFATILKALIDQRILAYD